MDNMQNRNISDVPLRTLSEREQHLLLNELWDQMLTHYGQQWTRNYGEAMTPEGGLSKAATHWLGMLDGFTVKQIGVAMKELFKQGNPHPPNVGSIYRMCAECNQTIHKPAEQPKLPGPEHEDLNSERYVTGPDGEQHRVARGRSMKAHAFGLNALAGLKELMKT